MSNHSNNMMDDEALQRLARLPQLRELRLSQYPGGVTDRGATGRVKIARVVSGKRIEVKVKDPMAAINGVEMPLVEVLAARLTATLPTLIQSVEDRDAMIASGMEIGVNEGYERLDEIMAG